MNTVPHGEYKGRMVAFLPNSAIDKILMGIVHRRNTEAAKGRAGCPAQTESAEDTELFNVLSAEALRRAREEAESVGGWEFYDPTTFKDRE